MNESLIVYYENREEELIKVLEGSKWWQAYRQKTIQSKKCLNHKQQQGGSHQKDLVRKINPNRLSGAPNEWVNRQIDLL